MTAKVKVSRADRARVALIIHRLDWSRIDQVGGYETEHRIENGKVYWADLDAGKEYQATELVVMSVRQFIAKHRDVLTDEWRTHREDDEDDDELLSSERP